MNCRELTWRFYVADSSVVGRRTSWSNLKWTPVIFLQRCHPCFELVLCLQTKRVSFVLTTVKTHSIISYYQYFVLSIS